MDRAGTELNEKGLKVFSDESKIGSAPSGKRQILIHVRSDYRSKPSILKFSRSRRDFEIYCEAIHNNPTCALNAR